MLIIQALLSTTASFPRPSKSPGYAGSLPVSRLIKANLPVITNVSNPSVSLLLSPVFFLFFRIEKLELSQSLVVRYRF